jgi:hypothetical protein
MATTLHEVLEFIRGLDLHSHERSTVIATLNTQVRAKRSEAKRGLYPGQRVTFFSNRSYKTVVGVITKVNRVNVDLREEGTGMKWRVSPQLLKPVVGPGDNDVASDEF